VSLTITVSISRDSAAGPPLSLIATIAPRGIARYSEGNSDAEIDASASGPPRQEARATSAMAMSSAIRTTSSESRPPITVENAISVKSAPRTDGQCGTRTPLAVKSGRSSSTAANNVATATASKMGIGANHTTTMPKAMSAAPLRTRVIGVRERAGRAGEAGKAGGAGRFPHVPPFPPFLPFLP
jgi:hypothetical protein